MFDWKSRAFPGYRPVREPWNTKIVNVHWPEEDRHDNYLRLFYTVYWKIYTAYADANHMTRVTGDGSYQLNYALAHSLPEEPYITDTILRSLVSYRNVFWPWHPINISQPAPGPYDVPPDEGHQNVAIFPGVTGAPSLPGDSDLLAGQDAYPGENFQGRINLNPAIRCLPGDGGEIVMRWPDDAPDPPDYTRLGITYVAGEWRAPIAKVQFYKWPSWAERAAGGMPGTFDTVQELPLNFSAVRVELSNTFYRAVAYAPEPKEEGAVLYDPPFSTDPDDGVAQNQGMDRTSFVVLCERMLDSEAEAEGLKEAEEEPPPEEETPP